MCPFISKIQEFQVLLNNSSVKLNLLIKTFTTSESRFLSARNRGPVPVTFNFAFNLNFFSPKCVTFSRFYCTHKAHKRNTIYNYHWTLGVIRIHAKDHVYIL